VLIEASSLKFRHSTWENSKRIYQRPDPQIFLQLAEKDPANEEIFLMLGTNVVEIQ